MSSFEWIVSIELGIVALAAALHVLARFR